MSTDHHLEDNADDQTRIPETPQHIRGRHPGTSAIAGSRAGQDFAAGSHLADLVGPDMHDVALGDRVRRDHVIREVGAPIHEGQQLEVRADGRVYPVDEEAGDLAEQLVDVAETAAAVDQVDEALADARPPAAWLYDFAEGIAGMANTHLQAGGLALEVVEACTGCGCTDTRGCPGGCYWITDTTDPQAPPRCSTCGPVDESANPPLEEQAITAQPWVSARPTIAGVEIQLDETIPKGEIHLRNDLGDTVGIFETKWLNVDHDAGLQVMRLVSEGRYPFAAAETVTRKPGDPDGERSDP